MRVAHVAPKGVHPYSGLLASLVAMAAGLAERGVEVEVWQLHEWPPVDTAELSRTLEGSGVEFVRMDPQTERWGRPALTPSQLRSRAVDVAHVHGVFNPTNNFLARDLEVPYVVSPHGGYAKESMAFHRSRKQLYMRLFERPMLDRAAAVCAVTDQEATELKRLRVRAPVHVVPNGAHAPDSGLDRVAFRHELGLETGTRLAVYAGRLDVRTKRLDRIIEGIARASGWHIALLGGDFRGGAAEIKRIANELGVSESVHLPPPRRGRDLDNALAAGDVFVLISRSEGMPMALLEALAAGTPAVVSAEVERSVGVAAAGAGWVVEPQSLGELLRRLDSSGMDELHARQASARALSRRYDWAAIAEIQEGIYRQVTAESR